VTTLTVKIIADSHSRLLRVTTSLEKLLEDEENLKNNRLYKFFHWAIKHDRGEDKSVRIELKVDDGDKGLKFGSTYIEPRESDVYVEYKYSW